jgi:HlyD family secretion protein
VSIVGETSFFRRHVKKLLALVVVLAVAGFAASKKLQPKPVIATAAARGTAIDAVYATGTVEAEDRVTIKAKSSGSLAEVFVKEGDAVKKGDLLARVDNPAATYELKRGRADLSAANAQASAAPQIAALASQGKALEAELEVAKKTKARVAELFGSGALPRAELDAVDARVRQIEAQIAANRAQQQAVRIDLNANRDRQEAVVESLSSRVTDTEVRSPQDGVVLAKLVEVGEVVSVNQPLFRVGDTSRLVLEAMVDEADIAKVTDGRDGKPASACAVSLYAYPKTAFAGTVFEVLPDANRERKAFLVKVRFDAPPPGLRSGMTAELNVIAGKKAGVLLAPAEAEAEGHVWVVRGGRVERRPVTIGIRDLLRIEIEGGLEEGDLVVVDGHKSIAEGTRVTVTERPMEKLEPMPDPSQPETTTLR